MNKTKPKEVTYDVPTIQSSVLRDNLGTIINEVHYQGYQYRIARNKRPMARVVPERFMSAVEQLIASDSALADTLALMMNDEAMSIIERGRKEWVAGERIPIEEVLLK